MIISKDVNGKVTEVRCDICGVPFDDEDELNEFMSFDYKMGPESLFPDKHVVFDVCQDCFTEAFPDIFVDDDDINAIFEN